jgi:DNA-binding response OmpR family regulator
LDKIDILIVDDDEASQSAMRQVLDSEGWRVCIVPQASLALQEMATGNWTLVIANVGMTGFSSPLYLTLKELAQAPPLESGKPRLRVLFLVPENVAQQARPVLEAERLPYVLKPFHLHDFLERVSDLLMESESILAPIRRVRQDSRVLGQREFRSGREAGSGQGSVRNTGMFANYKDYGMTEEEINEFEKNEAEETVRRKKKKLNPDKL